MCYWLILLAAQNEQVYENWMADIAKDIAVLETILLPVQLDADVALSGAIVFGGHNVQVTFPGTPPGW